MKFILLTFLLLFPTKEVIGKTYYSEYSAFSEYSEEKIEESDTVNVEVERRYKWYIRDSESGFYLMNENPFGYYYITWGVYRDTKFSNWELAYPEDKYGRLIEAKSVCDNEDCSLKHLEYRYKDRLFYHSKPIDKEKDGYYAYVEGYAKRGTDYKDYYRYQTRDKIDVPDIIVITDSSKNVSDYIISTCEYQIEGEIDYQKNGLYKIKIVTDFIEISADVEIIIKENANDDYENIIYELHKLLEEKDKAIKELESSNNGLQENIKRLENMLAEREKDYSHLQQQKDELIETTSSLHYQLKTIEEKKTEQDKKMEQLEDALEKGKTELNGVVIQCEQNLLEVKKELVIKEKSILFLEQSLKEKDDNIKQVSMDNYEEKGECSYLVQRCYSGSRPLYALSRCRCKL